MSSNTNYFLSGNFGSEIIRTVRTSSGMTSKFLLNIFTTKDNNTLFKELLNSTSLKYFKDQEIRNELEQIFEDIKAYRSILS